MRRLTFVLGTLAFLALPSLAQAAGAAERPKFLRAGVDLGFFAKDVGGTDFLNFSPEFSLLITAIPRLDLGLDWGLTWTRTDGGVLGGGSNSDSSFGNPYISAHYGSGGFKFGGGVALPMGNLNASSGANYLAAFAMRGFRNPWIWQPDTMTIVVPSLKYDRSLGPLEIGGDAAFALFIPAHENAATNRDVEFGLQYAVFGAVDIAIVRPGVRFGGYTNLSGDNITASRAQLYVEPFVGFNLAVVTLSASLVLPIDEPAGFAFDDDGFYAVRIGAAFEI